MKNQKIQHQNEIIMKNQEIQHQNELIMKNQEIQHQNETIVENQEGQPKLGIYKYIVESTKIVYNLDIPYPPCCSILVKPFLWFNLIVLEFSQRCINFISDEICCCDIGQCLGNAVDYFSNNSQLQNTEELIELKILGENE